MPGVVNDPIRRNGPQAQRTESKKIYGLVYLASL